MKRLFKWRKDCLSGSYKGPWWIGLARGLACGIFDLTGRGDGNASRLLEEEIQGLLKNHKYNKKVKLPDVVESMIDKFIDSCKGLRGNVNVKALHPISLPTEIVIEKVPISSMTCLCMWHCKYINMWSICNVIMWQSTNTKSIKHIKGGTYGWIDSLSIKSTTANKHMW